MRHRKCCTYFIVPCILSIWSRLPNKGGLGVGRGGDGIGKRERYIISERKNNTNNSHPFLLQAQKAIPYYYSNLKDSPALKAT